ncbi:MAG: lipid-transfer protein, partial [Candidatus Methylomirabilis sp.]|nr:lipid-transfer protein [Deltaproteobacteria bacterium]
MGRKVYVVGVGMTKFEKPGSKAWDYPDMVKEAGEKALADAGLSYDTIRQVAVGYCYGDSTCGERAVYELGLTGVPIYNVNNNCSTGSTALFLAKQLVEGGLADCAMAVGFEKMQKGSLGTNFTDRINPMDKHFMLMTQLREFVPAPPAAQMFGNAGREHMERYGTKAESFARIGHKNHKHSVNNPYSQFRDEYSLEDIQNAPMVYDPLTKLQCCPTSDGAGAAILASEDFVRKHGLQKTAVEIAGMAMATDFPSTFDEKSCIKLVGADMTRKAARAVYEQSGLGPENVDVIELHDCFSCNGLIT